MEQFDLNFAAAFLEERAVQKIAGWVADRDDKGNLELPVPIRVLTEEGQGLELIHNAPVDVVQSFLWLKSDKIVTLLRRDYEISVDSLRDIFSDLSRVDLKKTEEELIFGPIEVAADRCFDGFVNDQSVSDEDIAEALEKSPRVGDKDQDFYLRFVRDHRIEIRCVTWRKILQQAEQTLATLVADSSTPQNGEMQTASDTPSDIETPAPPSE